MLFSEQDIDYIAQRSLSRCFFPKSTAELHYSNWKQSDLFLGAWLSKKLLKAFKEHLKCRGKTPTVTIAFYLSNIAIGRLKAIACGTAGICK